MVKREPLVLGRSIKGNHKPKLAWLNETLGLDAKGISKLVQRRHHQHSV